MIALALAGSFLAGAACACAVLRFPAWRKRFRKRGPAKVITFVASLMAAFLLSGCAAKAKLKQQVPTVTAPARCIIVDGFIGACLKPKGDPGYICPNVHILIKPTQECNQFNSKTVSVDDLRRKK